MRPTPAPLKLAAVLAIGALMASACGARLSPAQRTEALNQGSGHGGGPSVADGGSTGSGTTGAIGGTGTTGTTGSAGTTSTGSTGTTGTTGSGTTGTLGTKGTSGTTGTTGTTGVGGSSGTTGNFQSAPAGGNGGKTDTGITGNSITIYNISDVSGAVPGLFEDARFATQAYVKYFTARYGTIYGRKLVLKTLDSQLDTGANRTAALDLCQNGFAGVGSVSAFDQGAAQPEQSCGVPDIRGLATTDEIKAVPNVFPVNAAGNGEYRGLAQFTWASQSPNAAIKASVKKAGYIYIDGDVTREQEQQDIEATTAAEGFDWIAQEEVGITDTDYTSYVSDLKSKGVQFVTFTGAYQQAANLVKTFAQQDYHPVVWEPTVTAYTPNYISQAGTAAEGTYVGIQPSLIEEAAGNTELQTYEEWLQQVQPGAYPTDIGEFAWGAAAFFVQEMIKLGPKPTRKGLIALIQQEHDYTDNGLFPGQDVGGKKLSDCIAIVQVTGGKFVRYLPAQAHTQRCIDGVYNTKTKTKIAGYPQ